MKASLLNILFNSSILLNSSSGLFSSLRCSICIFIYVCVCIHVCVCLYIVCFAHCQALQHKKYKTHGWWLFFSIKNLFFRYIKIRSIFVYL